MKNIFRKIFPKTETIYLGSMEATRSYTFCDRKIQFEMAVYKVVNTHTNKIIELYAVGAGERMEMNIDVFEDCGKLIQK